MSSKYPLSGAPRPTCLLDSDTFYTFDTCDICDRYVHDNNATQLFAGYALSPLRRELAGR